MTEIVALEALAARVEPGQSLAIPVDGSGVAMAATAALPNRKDRLCMDMA